MRSSGGWGLISTFKSLQEGNKIRLNPAIGQAVTFAALAFLVTGATCPEGDTLLNAFRIRGESWRK
jgi:hypothetical protein